MAKKLTVSALKTANKVRYDETQRVELDDEFYVDIFPYARDSKIQEIVQENLEDMAKEAEKEDSKFMTMLEIPAFSYMYIVRHLTELEIPKKIDQKAKIFVELADSGYLFKIIESFPEETLNSIAEGYDIVTQGMSQLNNMSEDEMKELSDKFKSVKEAKEAENKESTE